MLEDGNFSRFLVSLFASAGRLEMLLRFAALLNQFFEDTDNCIVGESFLPVDFLLLDCCKRHAHGAQAQPLTGLQGRPHIFFEGVGD